MKLNKKIAEYLAGRKQHDSYWVEQLKLDFSISLEKRRKNAGLSYADLAKKIGTSPAYISKIFRGDANFTIESMVKLSRATGGRVDLRIIDESMIADRSNWLAKIHHFPAANQAAISSNTVSNYELLDNEPLAA
jgi:transcriptional regulator with XRE-family HTH domain